MLPLLLACTSSPDDTARRDPPADTDTDADSDTDTDTDTDADSDADTDADPGPACGRYHALHLLGATGVSGFTAYAAGLYGYDGTNTNVTESYDEASGIGVISSYQEASGTSYRYYRSWSETTMECDTTGLWYRSSSTRWEYETSSGYVDTGTLVYAYDTNYLLLPSDLAVGSTWTASGGGSYSGDYSGSFTYDVSSLAAASESVTVPAGTYTGLKIQQTSSGVAAEYWVVEEIGTVKNDFLELESWAP